MHAVARDGGPPVEVESAELDWRRPHDELRRLAKTKGAYDAEEARWLRAAFAARVHARLGYSTFAEYLERMFGYAPRVAYERLRVAQALTQLALLQDKLARAELSWSAVRELTRVATPETEAAWVAHAEGKSVREIERDVSGRLPGDRPGDPERAEVKARRLVLDVSPETFATFREAVGMLRRQTETPLSAEEALLEMARRVLGGSTDDGEASYQIALTVCPSCGHGTQSARGEAVPVDPAVVEQAQCDARTFVSAPAAEPEADVSCAHVGPGDGAPPAATSGTPPAPPHVDKRPPPPTADSCAHVGTGTPTHVGKPRPTGRATQTIPPATRRRVIARDHGRCVVPGCRCATYVDLHHLKARAEGGTHADDNLVVLCGAHHRALHRGTLRITGKPTSGLGFTHADGTPYGTPVDPAHLDTHHDVVLGLKALGFTTREAEAASRAAVTHVGKGAPWAELMRAALRAARDGLDPAGRRASHTA